MQETVGSDSQGPALCPLCPPLLSASQVTHKSHGGHTDSLGWPAGCGFLPLCLFSMFTSLHFSFCVSSHSLCLSLTPTSTYTNAKWVFEWFWLGKSVDRLLRTFEPNGWITRLPATLHVHSWEKQHRPRFQHLLSWFLSICCTVFGMCLVLTPSVLARYFDHSFQVSLEHAEMVTDERREGKDLAWRRTGQADEAGHFVSLGKDHSFACIKFCFLLFLKLVPPVAFGGHALNISRMPYV